MKTKVEINGYEIEIEFIDGVITVKAEKDDEVVEEFSIETEESEDGEDVQSFGDFDEEEDFEGQGQDEDEDFEGQDEDENEDQDEEEMGSALESFQSFINKKRK